MNMQAAPDTTAIGQNRTPYNVDEIPEVKMDGMEKPTQNPLMPALETMTRFVQLQEQRGNPAATEMKQHLTAFMQAAIKGSQPQEQRPEYKVEVPEDETPAPKPGTDSKPNIQPLV